MRITRRGRRMLALLVTLAVVGGVFAWALRWPDRDVLVVERCMASPSGTTYDLAPEQTANAALISGVAVQRGLPARAATIGVATAIQESKLRNIDYGDRDSLGLFQQRPSQGWGTPEQIMDPVYATNAFYDGLVQVEGYQEMEVTVASDRVQRSAFPDAVAQHEHVGRAFASALTGWSPASMTCRLRPASTAGDVTAVVERLTLHLGDVGQSADAEAGTVTAAIGEDDAGQRRAWAVAHWAVAQADDLHVQRVSVDGQVWDRASSEDGWTQVSADSAVPTGQVVIEVATG